MLQRLDQAISNTRAHLLSLRNEAGHWEGKLSSSALSTATATVALTLVDAEANAHFIIRGARWLVSNQNADGGWGDTTVSKSNLSTTLLVWSALALVEVDSDCIARCEAWIKQVVGNLKPDAIVKAVVERYGKDRTFSVPILMTATLCGRLGENAWERVIALPFELAVFPRTWFGAIGLPVVSYALPALIAIGHARFHNAPPSKLSPMHWIRRWAWKRVRPMLHSLQPSSGGYLEATPLTSFVTMALAGAGEGAHPCVQPAVDFLKRSMRDDGSWPIDTNLATWGTTLAVKALGEDLPRAEKPQIKTWLLGQQYQTVHPFTNAAPGGWAWTDLPGGVPDADDTAGSLIALWYLCDNDNERSALAPQATAGVKWLLDLQNRDGGMPTFCRGWGTLPFDRSTPELTAHALWAWKLWEPQLPTEIVGRLAEARERSLRYLRKTGRFFAKLEANRLFASLPKGKVAAPRRIDHWEPLWFGNENAPGEGNPIYGTAAVLRGLIGAGVEPKQAQAWSAGCFLLWDQDTMGGWGGATNVMSTIEETAVALTAIAPVVDTFKEFTRRNSVPVERAVNWLLDATRDGTHFPSAPIGLYFARLWYHEQLYPVIWTLGALKAARAKIGG